MADGTHIRVLIADDHPVVRDGLRLVLERRADIEVVCEVADGREAVTRALHLTPDVAVVDLDMPRMSGTQVIKELSRSLPACRCLVLTLHEDDDHLFEALGAGAIGYILKGTNGDGIERAVRAAAAGQTVLGTEVAGRVTQALAAARPRRGAAAFPALSDRELELLDLMAAGLDNATVAQRLHLSPKTVRNQISSLLAKVGATDRLHAIAMAQQAGLGSRRSTVAP